MLIRGFVHNLYCFNTFTMNNTLYNISKETAETIDDNFKNAYLDTI
jgi:hypothetical protein